MLKHFAILYFCDKRTGKAQPHQCIPNKARNVYQELAQLLSIIGLLNVDRDSSSDCSCLLFVQRMGPMKPPIMGPHAVLKYSPSNKSDWPA